MNIIFDNFVFDSKRLILVKKEDFNKYEKVKENYPILCSSEMVLKTFDKYSDNSSSLPHGIGELGICLTNNCDFRCNYCIDSATNSNDNDLNIEAVKTFLIKGILLYKLKQTYQSTKDTFKIYFTGGGEQTYNWELLKETVKIIETICEQNNVKYGLGITTNGLLNGHQIQYLIDHFSSVMVSFDGNSEVQNKNRKSVNGSDTAEGVMKTIRNISKSETVKLTIRSTLWPEDFSHLREMAYYLNESISGDFEWNIRPVIIAGRAKETVKVTNNCKKDIFFSDAYFDLIEWMNQNSYSFKVTQSIFPTDLPNYSCGACGPFTNLLWLVPGNKIVTCIESFEITTQLAKIEQGKLEWSKHYQDPIFDMCRRKLKECENNCIAYPFCKGGCPIRHITNTTGDECLEIQRFWKLFLTRLLNGEAWFNWKIKKIKEENISIYMLRKDAENASQI